MSTESFEFAVVGGGKAGKTLAADFASAGRKVVLVERGMIGGTCINVACIPTKTMVRSAKAAQFAREAASFGVRADFHGVDLAGVRARKRDVVGALVAKNQQNFDRSGMTFILGQAKFVGPRTIEVQPAGGGPARTIHAEHVFINTGATPSLPDLPGLKAAEPLTSESILELDRLPEHLVVLGAGYIGCEFAQMFQRFGSKVTLLQRGKRFLPREDADVAEAILSIFREDGMEVLLDADPVRVDGKSGGSVQLTVQTPAGERTISGSDLLVAVGRSPATAALDLAAAGVEIDARGFVKVNERLETTAKGVWALGDVAGGPQFTHASLDHYRIVKANLAGGSRTTRDKLVPYTLFIDPELGRVGLSEEEARAKGLQIRVAKLPTAAAPRARTMSETRGFLKAVVGPDDRILGASILCPEGGEVMAVIQTAMLGNLPYTVLRDNIFAHPTMSEALNDLFAKLT